MRYRNDGANTLFDSKSKSLSPVFASLLSDPAWILLLFVSLVALCFRAFALVISILICGMIGVLFALFSYRKDKKRQSLLANSRMPTVTVIRDGKRYTISVRGVVAGDLLLLRAGDLVPCDCRLARSKNLRVQTLCVSEQGKLGYLLQEKSEKTLYCYDQNVSMPDAENILCGGSKIIRGDTYAIAVNRGEKTYLGSRDFSEKIPAEKGEGRSIRMSQRLIPYLRVYRFVTFAAFLPLTILGLLTAPVEHSIVTVFLSVCALAASASTSYLSLLIYTVESKAERACYEGAAVLENRALFKSDRASAQLSEITDLFVMGHCATSDGKTHLLGAWIGDGELDLTAKPKNGALGGLAEAFCLLDESVMRDMTPENLAAWRETFSLTLDETLRISGYDRRALSMRTLEIALLPAQSQEIQAIKVKFRDRTEKYLFSSDPQLITRCSCYEKNGEVYPLDSAAARSLVIAIAGRSCQHSSLQVVLRAHGRDLCLIGAMAFGEQTSSQLPTALQELEASGIRVSVFLKGSRAEEGAYAADLRLPERYAVVQKMRSNQLLDDDFIEKHRVLQGFTPKEVADLIQRMQRNGKRIAVMCVENADDGLVHFADLSIVCDEESFRKYAASDEVFERFSRDGTRRSSSATQAMRRAADILICRAQNNTGGLFAILEARLAACTLALRARIILKFLVTLHVARFAAVFFAVCFGVGLLSAPLLLYSGIVLETVAVGWLSSIPLSDKRIREACAVPFQTPSTELLFRKGTYLAPVLAVFCTMAIAFILSLCQVISSAETASLVFFSVLLLTCVQLLVTTIRISSKKTRARLWIPFSVILLPVALMLLLSIFFGTCNEVLNLGTWSPVSIALLPFMPCLIILFSKVFS